MKLGADDAQTCDSPTAGPLPTQSIFFALRDRSVLKIVPEDTGSNLAISVSCLVGNTGAYNAVLATRSRLIRCAQFRAQLYYLQPVARGAIAQLIGRAGHELSW